MADRKVQLVTIVMKDGSQATFLGVPLIENFEDAEIAEAWFSTTKTLDQETPLKELLEYTTINRDEQDYTH